MKTCNIQYDTPEPSNSLLLELLDTATLSSRIPCVILVSRDDVGSVGWGSCGMYLTVLCNVLYA